MNRKGAINAIRILTTMCIRPKDPIIVELQKDVVFATCDRTVFGDGELYFSSHIEFFYELA